MSQLPAGFEVLEPFVEGWALTTTFDRAQRRTTSTREERQIFYDTTSPLLAPALELLDQKSFAEHDAKERNLMNICLSLSHIALAVEALGDDEAKHAPHREKMIITRAPADA